MGPLPHGVRTVHMKASQGADTNIMKFYITQNSSTYGKYWENFKPRTGKPVGTGYLANFRPQIFYSHRLDDQDNPVMSHICARNYCSITKRDFKGYKENMGDEPLPINTFENGSGFTREQPVTVPKRAEGIFGPHLSCKVRDIFINTRAASAPADILPRHKPRLHTLRTKDPIQLENYGYGPAYMETETKVRFRGEQDPNPGLDRTHTTIGNNQDSGFTHNVNIEPITYEPGSAFRNDKPGWATYRPIGNATITNLDFVRYKWPDGTDIFPKGISHGSNRGSGFVREVAKPTLYLNRVMEDAYDKAKELPGPELEHKKKTNPAEFFNMIHPNNHSSISMDTYKGQQRPTPTHAEKLERHFIGDKELSGYSVNSPGVIPELDNPRRFITDYMVRFTDPTPQNVDRDGHCRGAVQNLKSDGFTKSVPIHHSGPDFNGTETLRRLQPYVARSLKARDQFFDDHTYDSKIRYSFVA